MGNLTYGELLTIRTSLRGYLYREVKNMEENRDIYSEDRIEEFSTRLVNIISKVDKIIEEEE